MQLLYFERASTSRINNPAVLDSTDSHAYITSLIIRNTLSFLALCGEIISDSIWNFVITRYYKARLLYYFTQILFDTQSTRRFNQKEIFISISHSKTHSYFSLHFYLSFREMTKSKYDSNFWYISSNRKAIDKTNFIKLVRSRLSRWFHPIIIILLLWSFQMNCCQ